MATDDGEAGGTLGGGWLVRNRPELFTNVGVLLSEGGDGDDMDGKQLITIEVTQKVPVCLRIQAEDPAMAFSPAIRPQLTIQIHARRGRGARKFTPRRPDSRWSTGNRRRYAALKANGLLAPAGLKRPPTTRSGDAPGRQGSRLPSYIEKGLKRNARAWKHFEQLAPSYRKAYVGWIDSAKREETKVRRLREAVRLLAAGQKLGLK